MLQKENILKPLDFLKTFWLAYFFFLFRTEVLREKTSHTVSVSNKIHFMYVVKTDLTHIKGFGDSV